MLFSSVAILYLNRSHWHICPIFEFLSVSLHIPVSFATFIKYEGYPVNLSQRALLKSNSDGIRHSGALLGKCVICPMWFDFLIMRIFQIELPISELWTPTYRYNVNNNIGKIYIVWTYKYISNILFLRDKESKMNLSTQWCFSGNALTQTGNGITKSISGQENATANYLWVYEGQCEKIITDTQPWTDGIFFYLTIAFPYKQTSTRIVNSRVEKASFVVYLIADWLSEYHSGIIVFTVYFTAVYLLRAKDHINNDKAGEIMPKDWTRYIALQSRNFRFRCLLVSIIIPFPVITYAMPLYQTNTVNQVPTLYINSFCKVTINNNSFFIG